MLLQIISNFVVGGCSHRIQLLIHSEYAKFDYEVLQCFGKLQGISYENFGLRDEFQIPCMEAITELDLLSHCQTPMEKLVCIRSASEKIVEEIGKSQEAMTEGSEVLTVATDDMLSLFVYSMIKAKPKRVRSDIVFIDIFFLGFGFNNHMTRDLEFYFANFQAAVSYITKDAEAHMIRDRASGDQTPEHTSARSRRTSHSASNPSGGSSSFRRTSISGDSYANRLRQFKDAHESTLGKSLRTIQFSDPNDLSALLSSSPPLHSPREPRKLTRMYSTMSSTPVLKADHPLALCDVVRSGPNSDDEI
eukprot:TRINITY_DN4247_c0_g1_i1.p2 TRINITY_DN4247_c0_g1~~TRINITY_DN4247_c0_g1_i1.p2  ORF type:complete len:305 (+),score=64.74 TRINITY_DN4247_c0_g1_i1:1527-2441(+)